MTKSADNNFQFNATFTRDTYGLNQWFSNFSAR